MSAIDFRNLIGRVGRLEYNLYGTTNVDASVNVSDGTKTCNSHTVRKIMDESLCKVENMEYLRIRDDVDEEYAYARYYRNSNEVEFEECIKSIAVEQESQRQEGRIQEAFRKIPPQDVEVYRKVNFDSKIPRSHRPPKCRWLFL